MASTPSSTPNLRMVSESIPLASASSTAAWSTRSLVNLARGAGSGSVIVILRSALTNLRCRRCTYNISLQRKGSDGMARDKTDESTAGPLAKGVSTMRAIVQDRYGEADTMRPEQVARPTIKDDEVLLRVRAAAVDWAVWHLMAGLPYPVRLSGLGFRFPRERIRGREVAGIVEAVGKNVTTLQVGDEVFGFGEGCFAEYARARGDKLAPKPTGLTFEQAAALTVSATTALQAVRDIG